MQGSENSWNEERLLTEMEKMQDQIDTLMAERNEWKQEALKKQQKTSELSSQVSLLKEELLKTNGEIIRITNETDWLEEEKEHLEKENRHLRKRSEQTRTEAEAMVQSYRRNIKGEMERKLAAADREADHRFSRMRAGYQLLFVLSCLYGIMVTLMTAMRSKAVCRDTLAFLVEFRKAVVALVRGIDFIAGFLAEKTGMISDPTVRTIISGMIYFVISALFYGTILFTLSYIVSRFWKYFRENLADEYTAFMAMTCIAIPVFYGTKLRGEIQINLNILSIILFTVCMCVRWLLVKTKTR